ncbi:general substrate transporter [Amniculicola lignicola CBS 123094]|uniref:General substrate transporter n=1 Tax=Amniculicola lignicola CBS 123094 TaxID=1392246 RepID=A0A6A5WIV2_9PLEO|nr:general substrate transporter [Amniculicola lignicola CBS 123094]
MANSKAFFTHPREWSLYRDMTFAAWRVALLASIGAMVFGYDTAWWSGVLGMPAFTSRYGTYNAATKKYALSSALTSSGSGIPTAGRIIGSIATPYIADNIGRRWCMMVMAILFIASIIVEVTAKSYWQIVFGRFFNYIPMGIAGALVPVYQAECAPASTRGGLVTMFTWFVDFGALIASCIVFSTHSWTGEGAYKYVMGIQMLFPIMILVALPFIPESPRFLCMKGRREEALSVMKMLRKDEQTAENEITDIESSLEKHVDTGSWLDLVRGSNLRRTIISVTIPTVEAWQGQSFMGNYLVLFLMSLGATNQYLLSTMLQAVLLISVTLTFWMSDHLGRRPLLLFGSATMWITFFIVSGVSGHDTTNTSDQRKQVAVGMLFIWAIAYACTYQPVGYLAPAEIPTTKLRSKTAGVAYFFQQCGGLIVTFVAPYMQDPRYGNMGPYIGFFFGGISFLGLVFVFFCFPEAKGLSIEQLDELFETRLPTREFSKEALTHLESLGLGELINITAILLTRPLD